MLFISCSLSVVCVHVCVCIVCVRLCVWCVFVHVCLCACVNSAQAEADKEYMYYSTSSGDSNFPLHRMDIANRHSQGTARVFIVTLAL